ncbi:MAG TPA: Maf family protein [Gammaproteobacteria bacterium]|nr:Maf family protein [Gammaproteobacteria bacterium]
MKLFLASRSPRRQELLQQIGIEFELVDVDVDERWDRKEIPKDYVRRIALEKARAGKNRIDSNGRVLAADTAVVLDNSILGKAATGDDATEMLKKLSGRTHDVLSAVAVIDTSEQCLTSRSRVSFKPLSEDEIREYCKTGEPVGKAGGYAIQGRAGCFVSHLDGSYSGVMGLPLYETASLLGRSG